MCGSVVGASSLVEDDVSRMFLKFVFGSFVESFGVSPSGELLGLRDREVPASLIKTGLGCGNKGTYVPGGSFGRCVFAIGN
jgi:hypothetical protein